MAAPMTRAEQKQATRDELVRAARTLFVDQGYPATSAEAIARAAGVSRATFYLHFRSKAEVVVGLMRALEAGVAADYQALDALVGPDLDAVTAWLHRHAEQWRRSRNEYAAMEQALANEPAVADEWFAMVQRTAASMTRLLARQPDEAARAQARVHAVALEMSVDRNFHFAIVRGHDENFGAVVRALAEQWLVLLRD